MSKLLARLRGLRRGNKGSVLAEVAFVTLLLMTIVIGMGSVAVQLTSVENQGRLARELADQARLLLEEESSWTPMGRAMMEELTLDRMRLPESDVAAAVFHARRNPTTGEYEVLETVPLGGATMAPALAVVNAPDPYPGLRAQGQTITLDLGEEVVVVQTMIRFFGIPRGIGSASVREAWALVPIDP